MTEFRSAGIATASALTSTLNAIALQHEVGPTSGVFQITESQPELMVVMRARRAHPLLNAWSIRARTALDTVVDRARTAVTRSSARG
jgi:hypothetical protein